MEGLKLILIAKILSAHGVSGKVKIQSYLSNAEDIKLYLDYLIDDNRTRIIINSIERFKNDIFIANVFGVNNREEAKGMYNIELFIDRKHLPKEEDGEFYYSDLINLSVMDENNRKIGKIKNIMNFGAGDLIEVDFDNKFNDIVMDIFPINGDIITNINIKDGFITFKKPLIE